VKKQTTVLVLIGVILFIAGSAIAFASVKGASKHAGSGGTAAAPASTSAVVAKADIPAGTTGQAMVSRGLVALQLVPLKSFVPTDLTSLQALNDEVLTTPVQKGHAVTATQLQASTSAISIPNGLDAMTVTISGAGDLSGYLQPGEHVDVYANITRLSTGANPPVPVPCTELAMTNIEVLDVSSTAPSFAATAPTKGGTGTGRAVPGSETLLLAVQPTQARTLQFLTQNETISVVQPQQEVNPPAVGQCIGSGQGLSAP
jgi:Flp pilus assembly protein CpaB